MLEPDSIPDYSTTFGFQGSPSLSPRFASGVAGRLFEFAKASPGIGSSPPCTAYDLRNSSKTCPMSVSAISDQSIAIATSPQSYLENPFTCSLSF